MTRADEARPPAIDPDVFQDAVDHMYSNTSVEMGGFFVGTLTNGIATIDAAIPALSAPSSLVNLTFDHDTWTDVVNQVDRDHAGKMIVGWFHSHPGHGVFLSGYDEFIQTSFFSADGMVALVVDPRDGSTGWFTTVDGAIDDPIRDSIAPAKTDRSRSAAAASATSATDDGPSRTTIAVSAVVAAIIGALGGFLIARAVVDTSETTSPQTNRTVQELREQQAADQATIERLQRDRVSDATSNPERPPADQSTTTTITPDSYTIQPDDTLIGIAKALYGDEALWDALYNYRSNDELIGELGRDGQLPGSAVGRRITVPTREELT
jgi:proteasome lid subunit RPN8/RPN11